MERFDVAVVRDVVDVLRCQVGLLDVDCVGGPDAVKLLSLFSAAKAICAAGETAAARRIEQTNAHLSSGHSEVASFVAVTSGVSTQEARSALATGRALESLPETASRFRSGSLSAEQTREVARGAIADPSAESGLLALAERDSVSAVRRERARLESSRRSDETSWEHRHQKRYLRVRPDGNGLVDVYGRFTTEDWGQVSSVLEPLRKKIFHQARRQGRHESHDAYGADALVAMASSSNGDSGSKPKATLNVLVSHDALVRGNTDSGERCEIPGVGPISVATARALADDCFLNVLVTKGLDVTTVASQSRYVPKALRAALGMRDLVCSIKGCDISIGLELDHRISVHDGGPTRLDNVAYLCRYHHYLKTHKGYQLHGRTGDYELVPPGKSPPPVPLPAG